MISSDQDEGGDAGEIAHSVVLAVLTWGSESHPQGTHTKARHGVICHPNAEEAADLNE